MDIEAILGKSYNATKLTKKSNKIFSDESGSSAEEKCIENDNNDPSEIVKKALGKSSSSSGSSSASGSSASEESSSASDYKSKWSDSESSDKKVAKSDTKTWDFMEYEKYMTAIRKEGHDVSDEIPKVTVHSSKKKIAKARDKAREYYNRISSSTIPKLALTFGCNVIESIFDGTRGVGSFKPDLTGWSDEVSYRIDSDLNIQSALSGMGSRLNSYPGTTIAIGLLLSALTHSQSRQRAKKSVESSTSQTLRRYEHARQLK